MEQAIGCVDHIGIIVYQENLKRYAEYLSNLLQIEFDEPTVNPDLGIVAACAWDARLELIAPTNDSSEYYARLETFGEGTTTIVFGVEDIDKAVERAGSLGVSANFEAKLEGSEPWLKR